MAHFPRSGQRVVFCKFFLPWNSRLFFVSLNEKSLISRCEFFCLFYPRPFWGEHTFKNMGENVHSILSGTSLFGTGNGKNVFSSREHIFSATQSTEVLKSGKCARLTCVPGLSLQFSGQRRENSGILSCPPFPSLSPSSDLIFQFGEALHGNGPSTCASRSEDSSNFKGKELNRMEWAPHWTLSKKVSWSPSARPITQSLMANF